MLIKLNEMEEKVMPAFYGGEGALCAKLYTDGTNKMLRGRLAPGSTIGLHTHETSMEVIFILSGHGKSICDGKEEILTAGDCHYCPKGSEHCLINTGAEDLLFYAVVAQQ